MILRYMSIVYLPYSRCINIRVGLFIISINHVLLSIYRNTLGTSC